MLTLGYFNAKSIRQKAGEIREFLVDNALDVLFLTETWLFAAEVELYLRELTSTDSVAHSLPAVDAVEVALPSLSGSFCSQRLTLSACPTPLLKVLACYDRLSSRLCA